MQRSGTRELGPRKACPLPTQDTVTYTQCVLSRILHIFTRKGPDDDTLFAEAVHRARRIQKLGYDVGFTFTPRFPDTPFLWLCSGRFNSSDGLGTGYSFHSRTHAFISCFQETMERALWIEQVATWKENGVWSAHTHLIEPHVDISHIAGFSDAQRHTLKLASLDLPLRWSRGYDVASRTPLLIPSQLVSSRYAANKPPEEPLLRFSNSNGLASHITEEGALLSGMYETIERDAFMITFHNQISPPRLPHHLCADEKTQKALKSLQVASFIVDFMLLPTDMPAHVVACVIRDATRTGPAFAIGAKAHHSLQVAVSGALTEAFGVWTLARHHQLYKKPPGATAHMNALERIAFWAAAENSERLAWLYTGPTLSSVPTARHPRSSSKIAHAAQKSGVHFGALTLSTPILEKEKFHAVMVVSSELQPLNLDSSPCYLGGKRLRSVPEKFGYSVRTEPPPYPHPFP